MFLDLIRRRNPSLSSRPSHCIRQAKFPPTPTSSTSTRSRANARIIAGVRRSIGLKIFAMTKQMGRNGSFCHAVDRGGIAEAVAVDMECARATHRAGWASAILAISFRSRAARPTPRLR